MWRESTGPKEAFEAQERIEMLAMNKKRNTSFSENKEEEISRGPSIDANKCGQAAWPQFSQ